MMKAIVNGGAVLFGALTGFWERGEALNHIVLAMVS